jgi:hypothetical protein
MLIKYIPTANGSPNKNVNITAARKYIAYIMGVNIPYEINSKKPLFIISFNF